MRVKTIRYFANFGPFIYLWEAGFRILDLEINTHGFRLRNLHTFRIDSW